MARLSGYAGAVVFFSLCYLVLRRVLQIAALRGRANDFKELEIVVLRHELAILPRRTRPPAIRSQLLQQYTPPCPEHVPEPVEHENARSLQTACGGPVMMFTHAAIEGSGPWHTG